MRFSRPPVLSVHLSAALRAPSRKGRRFISCQQLKLPQQAHSPFTRSVRETDRIGSFSAAKSLVFTRAGFSFNADDFSRFARRGSHPFARRFPRVAVSVKAASQRGRRWARSLAAGY